MSKKRKNKNSVTVTNEEVIENEKIVNDDEQKQGGRIIAMLNGMMENANNVNVNGGNTMNTQNNNQVAQQVMQQATVAGGGQPQVQAVPVQMTSPNLAAQAQYVMNQQGQAIPVQFVDPNQVQQLMQQQAVAQQLTNPNPDTQAQQVLQGAVAGQQAQAQQPKVVYVPVPAQAQQQAAAPQVVVETAEEESSFSDDHPWLTLGLIAAGAYVGYKFVSNVFFDGDDNSSSVSENDTIDLVPADFSSFF